MKFEKSQRVLFYIVSKFLLVIRKRSQYKSLEWTRTLMKEFSTSLSSTFLSVMTLEQQVGLHILPNSDLGQENFVFTK